MDACVFNWAWVVDQEFDAEEIIETPDYIIKY